MTVKQRNFKLSKYVSITKLRAEKDVYEFYTNHFLL
jgi:hypothetical protein